MSSCALSRSQPRRVRASALTLSICNAIIRLRVGKYRATLRGVAQFPEEWQVLCRRSLRRSEKFF
jgi:hypothetical protein